MSRAFFVLMIASILGGGYLAPKTAMADESCLDEIVTATGKPSSVGELARANSFFTWKAITKEKLGPSFMEWSNATERKLICIDIMTGEHKGKWQCTRHGRPCKLSVVIPEQITQACQQEIISAYGARKPSKNSARTEAELGWTLKVKKALGAPWSEWERAQQQSISCTKKNRRQYQCIASAYACKN